MIVGPLFISTTLPGAPNDKSVSSIIFALSLSYSSSTVNDIPYTDNFLLDRDRAYLVGFVPEGTTKVTVNGFDLTMFQEGATRFHYILSEGFNNLKVGLNELRIQYEKDGRLSPLATFTVNYQQN